MSYNTFAAEVPFPIKVWRKMGLIIGDFPNQPPLFKQSGDKVFTWKDNYGEQIKENKDKT